MVLAAFLLSLVEYVMNSLTGFAFKRNSSGFSYSPIIVLGHCHKRKTIVKLYSI